MTNPLPSLRSLCLVGCGKMGGALLEGWLRLGVAPASISVVDPHLPLELAEHLKERGVAVNPPPKAAEALLVAVKPQVLDGILPDLRAWLDGATVVVSVVAGKTIAQFNAGLGGIPAIIRTIPNTPAAVGRGVTVGIADDRASASQRALAAGLLGAVGAFEWIADENLMDAATAVSGSGPAYVFHLVEALAAAGEQQGLPRALAQRLARLTIEGAGELLHQSPLSPETLRQNVTSPGGTTAAALRHLMDVETGFPPLLARAVAAATQRGRELADNK